MVKFTRMDDVIMTKGVSRPTHVVPLGSVVVHPLLKCCNTLSPGRQPLHHGRPLLLPQGTEEASDDVELLPHSHLGRRGWTLQPWSKRQGSVSQYSALHVYKSVCLLVHISSTILHTALLVRVDPGTNLGVAAACRLDFFPIAFKLCTTDLFSDRGGS